MFDVKILSPLSISLNKILLSSNRLEKEEWRLWNFNDFH